MNRAAGFSRVAKTFAMFDLARVTREAQNVYATSNAVATARIYVRQAKRSFRHRIER
ncbi:MAG TPA: hypothetical protein VF887_01710 [Gemmatimonadaceae bacterium]